MSCCDEHLACVPDTDVSRRSVLKGAALITSLLPVAHPKQVEAQGKQVIHLEIGEPDFPTPGHVVSEAKQALDEGWTHYGPTQGLPDLREAIAAHISRSRGIR